jgi:hypothetical protein
VSVLVCERRARVTAKAVDEREVARRWWSLPLPSLLPVNSGNTYQLLYAGRPGGSMGPDVHDAVLRVLATDEQLAGDVEFHTASSEWRQHHHDDDPRYNQVILHVVLICNDLQPTLRQDGTVVPVCSLYDLPPPAQPAFALPLQTAATVWPCQQHLPLLSKQACNKLLREAGLMRFEQKAHTFVEQLHAFEADVSRPLWPGRDTAVPTSEHCLLVALAEALGYGRDRALFQAIGRVLLGQTTVIPEPLAHTAEPSPLDTRRLHVLRSLSQLIPELWPTLHTAFCADTAMSTLAALRAFFVTRGLSQARTDILLCNVVLPFAVAVALLEQNAPLAERAEAVYLLHPGLPSNAITRMMTRQLLLEREPSGACRQQGLHSIYQQTCHAKLCAVCIAGRSVL